MNNSDNPADPTTTLNHEIAKRLDALDVMPDRGNPETRTRIDHTIALYRIAQVGMLILDEVKQLNGRLNDIARAASEAGLRMDVGKGANVEVRAVGQWQQRERK